MRGHVRKNGKKWANVIYLGIDANGKKKYKWFSGYNSRKEAEDNLFKDMQRAEKYLHDEKDMTVKQLFEDWFENYAKKKYAYRTYENYKCLAENNLLPMLGDEKVIDLTTYKIQRFVNKLEGAPATVKKNLSILKVMLDQAIRWELLDKNPCQNVTTPSVKKQEMDVWDEDIVFRFLKELEGDKLYMPFILALTAGLRQGEICGLRWEDYNIKQGRIHIVRSMQRNMEPKDTKTSSGRRSIKLLSTTIKALEKQKEWQKEQADLFTDEYTNTGYICTMDNGQPMNPGYLQKRFTVLKKRYKLPDIRFHDLRHSFATMLLRNQVNPKIVQEMLGHSNVQTTLNVYSHVLPDMQDEAAKKLENALFNKES